MKLRHQYPHLYEVKSENAQWSVAVKKLCATVNDYISYFIDTFEEEDVLKVERKMDGVHKGYEMARLQSLIKGIDNAVQTYSSSDIHRADIQAYLDNVQQCLDYAVSVQSKIDSCDGYSLCKLYSPLLKHCHIVLNTCKMLHLPHMKKIIAEFTDAGPGVGVSNYEVSFRMVEMSRLHNTVRRTRIHRSRGDSAQNESERTNACVGEAVVDGSALRWNYYSLDDNTQEELQSLNIDEITKLEEEITEKNAWRVAQEVCERVHMEPGPAGDLMLCLVEDELPNQFFFKPSISKCITKLAKQKRRNFQVTIILPRSKISWRIIQKEGKFSWNTA